MLRGGTSRGLFFEPGDLPADPAARDELLLRLMGTPDPRQIDGLGGSTSLTSKVAVVGPSDHPDADVDYLFLQLGVDEPTVSDQQNCGNILAGVGPFAVERGLVPAGSHDTNVRIRMVNSDSIAVAHASHARRPGRVPRRRRHRRRARHRAHRSCSRSPTPRDRQQGACCPPGNVRDSVDGIEVTCVDNGMPVVVAMAESFGLTGDETARAVGRRHGAARAGRRLPVQGRAADGPRRRGRVVRAEDRPALPAPGRRPGLHPRPFIPVQPHTAIGVLAAVSVVTAMLLPGAVGHELAADWPHGLARRSTSSTPPATCSSTWWSTPRPLLRGSSARVSSARPASSSTAPPSRGQGRAS